MKHLATLLSCLFLTAGAASASELLLAQRLAPSPYAIVLPDTTGNPSLDQFLSTGATCLRQAILDATGVSLPIQKESQLPPGTPGIFIGSTRALAQAGLSSTALFLWEHRIVVRGNHLFLYGNDVVSHPNCRWPRNYHYFVLGSLKAVTVFMERFVNTRFLVPGPSGIATRPLSRISVPDTYAYSHRPRIQYCMWGGHQEMLYDIANNAFSAPWYGSYGGHSHDKAIPPSTYYQNHPEYFALINGKRTTHPTRPQYCLSNPRVQELIYQELVNHLNQGYDMVQLGQSDGFRPCQCGHCKQLFGVDSWGEKLWILHRNLAQRLLLEHPGKKVCILAYGPTLRPPTTFQSFPDNVMIELAPCTPSTMKAWQNIRVKQGFVAYVYNWGVYHQEGFTPKRTRDFLTRQAQDFNRNNIRGIYTCGNSDLYGLEGPAYYQWCRQLHDPDLDAQKLLEEYCTFAFGTAAPHMENLYRLLDERLRLDNQTAPADWNDPMLLDGLSPNTRSNLKLLALRYPRHILNQLEKHLTLAEKAAPKNRTAQLLIPIARMEFTYLKTTMDVIHAMGTCEKDPHPQHVQALLDAVQRRNDFIGTIPVQPRTRPPRAAYRQQLKLFSHNPIQVIRDGGTLRAPLLAPFNWNVTWMKQHVILPLGRTLRADGAPQFLVQKNFHNYQEAIVNDPATISCRWDSKGLTVVFAFPNSKQETIANDQIQLILDDGKKHLWLTGRARHGRLGAHLRTRTSAENQGNGDQYQRLPKAVGLITAPAPGQHTASAQAFIPWTCFDAPPHPGDRWGFNAIRETTQAGYIWNFNLMQKTWRNLRDTTGTIIFN